MTVSVELMRSFHVIPGNDLEAQCDLLMDELLKLEASGCVRDSAVSVDLGEKLVEIEVIGDAPTFDEALQIADSSIRTAIHAVGGETPGWEPVTFAAQNAELVSA